MRWQRSTDAGTAAWPAWRWHPGSRGQGLVEYGLILSLSALVAVVLLVVFGAQLSALLQVVGDAIDAAT